MNRLVVLVILASLLAVFLVGCKVVPAEPGDLSGTITWQSATIAGATVNVWGTGNTKVSTAVSDQNGHYIISKIPSGTGYLVTCHQAVNGTAVEKGWMFPNIEIKPKGNTQLDMTSDNAIKDAVLPSSYQ
jgi:hypothetical protein